MNTKKIVITGGPGTGKSSVLQEFSRRGYTCFPEISRQVTLEAQQQGISQLFLTDPLLFSKKLLEGREKQFLDAEKRDAERVFIDRGVHDVLAYMDYAGNPFPPYFTEVCEKCRYDAVFVMPPWKDIYVSDNERYEDFQQATAIYRFIKSTYIAYGYELVEVPTGSIPLRADFILEKLGIAMPE
ncbi:ATP-binding protein [Sinomicrobium kalidii]|uniref:AAA family ATPase n=1 Tax=Sinomicrobium kalidii TaxID=2900738 RepID=UPI001E59E446|nr:ATP-binding protein [Sinomicrobium kalidii]UGU15826.1 ATP-binding protein [Sinomicrobium kalidii]